MTKPSSCAAQLCGRLKNDLDLGAPTPRFLNTPPYQEVSEENCALAQSTSSTTMSTFIADVTSVSRTSIVM
jgi:hypothetical protein